jgi:hypothetical protein
VFELAQDFLWDDPNDPRNWPVLHQQFEARKKIKELMEAPHEEIHESFVDGCSPSNLG